MSRPLPKPQTMTIQEWVESKDKEKKKRSSRNRKSFKNKPRLLPTKNKLKKSIVFIDNDDANWKSDMSRFKDSIDYIHIPNGNSPEESNYTKSLAKKGNRYAAAIIDIMGPNAKSYPANNGINESVAKNLKAWSSRQGDKYALFDWDRTISCVEGIVPSAIPSDDNNLRFSSSLFASQRESGVSSKEFLDDVFKYLMREDRIPMLKSLFRELKDKGVNIHILTNNPAASVDSPYRSVFIEMLSRLFNDDDEKMEEREYMKDGIYVSIFSASSSKLSLVGREELESMLHSTIDYTLPGKPLHKSNMVCSVVPEIRHCPRNNTRRRRRPLVPLEFMMM